MTMVNVPGEPLAPSLRVDELDGVLRRAGPAAGSRLAPDTEEAILPARMRRASWGASA